ncbi:unnamed protein product, partial [Allacma fusca]
VLEPSRHTQSGFGRLNIDSMDSASNGLNPEASSYLIPLRSVSAGRKKKEQVGGGRKNRSVQTGGLCRQRRKQSKRSKGRIGRVQVGEWRKRGKRRCVK